MGSPKRTTLGNFVAMFGALAIFLIEDIAIRNSNGKFWTSFIPILILGLGCLLAWIDFTFKKFPKENK